MEINHHHGGVDTADFVAEERSFRENVLSDQLAAGSLASVNVCHLVASFSGFLDGVLDFVPLRLGCPPGSWRGGVLKSVISMNLRFASGRDAERVFDAGLMNGALSLAVLRLGLRRRVLSTGFTASSLLNCQTGLASKSCLAFRKESERTTSGRKPAGSNCLPSTTSTSSSSLTAWGDFEL